MSTLILINKERVLTCLKFSCITCLIILFAFSARAQSPGQLPVNLKIFKAGIENKNTVKVFWTTSYEKDNGYFDIERSVDGANFFRIGRVAGVNRSGILTDYIFYDNSALKGISYYRLKQVDVDLKYTYSPIERVRNLDTDNSTVFYPNPATGSEFKIDLVKNIAGVIDVMVFDLSGRLQLQQQFSNTSTLSIRHHLPAGIYTVKIFAGDLAVTRKLVIN